MPQKIIDKWVRPEIRKLAAYHVPDARDFIKLDAMENPYTWSEQMRQDWLNRLSDVHMNRYPDPASTRLRAQIQKVFSVPEGMQVLLGNGSDELIQMICMAVARPGRVVMAPEPSFVMYRMIAQATAMDYVAISLGQDFELELDSMLAAIDKHQPAVVFLAYPNNPTGNLFDADAIVKILQAAPGLVVVDEAYSAFTSASMLSELSRFPNLLIMRTVSKMGLAGLRLGWLAGDPAWLAQFDKVRLPYNINILTQVTTEFALAHKAFLDQQTEQIKLHRAQMFSQLNRLAAVQVFPSEANFLLIRLRSHSADEVFTALKDAGILIKNMHRTGTLLENCLRVTVGRDSENQLFLDAFTNALE